MKLVNNQRGQSLIEYVILVALIGIASIGMVKILEGTIQQNITGVIGALQDGHVRAPHYRTVTDHDLREKDFSNFWQGSRSHERGGHE